MKLISKILVTIIVVVGIPFYFNNFNSRAASFTNDFGLFVLDPKTMTWQRVTPPPTPPAPILTNAMVFRPGPTDWAALTNSANNSILLDVADTVTNVEPNVEELLQTARQTTDRLSESLKHHAARVKQLEAMTKAMIMPPLPTAIPPLIQIASVTNLVIHIPPNYVLRQRQASTITLGEFHEFQKTNGAAIIFYLAPK